MKCPVCGAPSYTLSTRRKVIRRRQCTRNHRFTTKEVLYEPAQRRNHQPKE